ncbi:MAG: histidine phosphatase family protein [Bacilli bacterium]|jgi:broad specificity phosphatase PhoE|nr:histidine phosphatase family protein [Bacilli bacterium]
MALYVTRHGETDWNRVGKIQGIQDIPLNSVGRKEAKELKEKVAALPLDRMISSPLSRAYQTALIVNEDRHLPLTTDVRIREEDYGDLEGKECFQELFSLRGQYFVRYPHGEGYLDVAFRVFSFLDDLKKADPASNILIVTHAGISRVINSYFHDMTNEEFSQFHLDNCQVIRYDFSDRDN